MYIVGTNVGDIGLWDVGMRERLVLRNFKVWELSQCSMVLQVCILIKLLYLVLAFTLFFGWIFSDRRVRLYGGCGAREKVIFVDGVGEQEKKSILGYFSSVWHSVLMKLICGTLFLIRCPLCTFFFPHYV